MKHKNKLECPFKLDEVYVEFLQTEIKVRFDKCSHCGNKTRDYQLRRLVKEMGLGVGKRANSRKISWVKNRAGSLGRIGLKNKKNRCKNEDCFP